MAEFGNYPGKKCWPTLLENYSNLNHFSKHLNDLDCPQYGPSMRTLIFCRPNNESKSTDRPRLGSPWNYASSTVLSRDPESGIVLSPAYLMVREFWVKALSGEIEGKNILSSRSMNLQWITSNYLIERWMTVLKCWFSFDSKQCEWQNFHHHDRRITSSSIWINFNVLKGHSIQIERWPW